MDSFLITVDGSEHEVSTGTVRHLLDTSARFWLDLDGVDSSTADALLRNTFGFHPLAVQDAEHFGQRPKIDAYDDFVLMVVYGATGSGRLVEVHCFYTETYLVTVHRDASPEMTALAGRLRQRAEPRPDHVMLLYLVVETLIDGYFPVLADLDDQIDELEDAILERPTDQQLGQLFGMKRWLIALRRVVTPQRDMFATLASGTGALPGMTPDAERYYRALYDQLIRISDLVDSYRDLISGAGVRVPGHGTGGLRPACGPGAAAERGLGGGERVHERDRRRAGLAGSGGLGDAPGRRAGHPAPHARKNSVTPQADWYARPKSRVPCA